MSISTASSSLFLLPASPCHPAPPTLQPYPHSCKKTPVPTLLHVLPWLQTALIVRIKFLLQITRPISRPDYSILTSTGHPGALGLRICPSAQPCHSVPISSLCFMSQHEVNSRGEESLSTVEMHLSSWRLLSDQPGCELSSLLVSAS